jgi:hypothetical protein
MKSSCLTLMILAALPAGSDQQHAAAAAAAGASLQEHPMLQASETDPAFSLFDNKEVIDEEKEAGDFDDEEEDETVGSTHRILKSFCPLLLELYVL